MTNAFNDPEFKKLMTFLWLYFTKDWWGKIEISKEGKKIVNLKVTESIKL